MDGIMFISRGKRIQFAGNWGVLVRSIFPNMLGISMYQLNHHPSNSTGIDVLAIQMAVVETVFTASEF